MDAALPRMVTLELEVAPEAVPVLRRSLALGRARALTLTWYDCDGALAGEGITASASQLGRVAVWRAEALSAPAGAAPVLLGEATSLAGLHLRDGLVAVAQMAGQVREGRAGSVVLRLVNGQIGAAPGTAIARLYLAGPADAVAALTEPLAPAVRVPRSSLAAVALALAGIAVPARPLGSPVLPAGLAPGDAFADAAAHLLGVLLHYAPRAEAGETGEPVHQMRVAMRRLRSLISVFGDAVACPELAALAPGLKELAGALGPARDWDVFLAGTGAAVAAAFADEGEIATLLAAAAARRADAYAALVPQLAGPALHVTALRIAILVQARPWARPSIGPSDGPSDGYWDGPGDRVDAQDAARTDAGVFAATVLARRLRRLAKRAAHIGTAPEAALHEMRIHAKRLRYAAEVFAPLFPARPARRFLKRLAALQDVLGLLNDGVVAASLMHDLAAEGGCGLAGGMVRGFVAARAAGARHAIARAYKRLRKAGPFWT